jgi:manganese/zinc/iron transport system ATP- binding protein
MDGRKLIFSNGKPNESLQSNSSMDPIEIRDLTVAYHTKPVIWDVDLTIPEGKLVAIVGPNGAGKTTLIKAILGLAPKAAGKILIYGKPYSQQRRLVAYVPQRGTVDWDFPTNALDVVEMGLYGKLGWIKRPNQATKKIALECLRKVSLEDFANRQIGQLSGGQQQRVFLARALAQNAKIYLMDEPLNGVDAVTEETILSILRELRRAGSTIVMVHHDLQTVKKYFEWVVMLNLKLITAGSLDKVFTEENLRLAYGRHSNSPEISLATTKGNDK